MKLFSCPLDSSLKMKLTKMKNGGFHMISKMRSKITRSAAVFAAAAVMTIGLAVPSFAAQSSTETQFLNDCGYSYPTIRSLLNDWKKSSNHQLLNKEDITNGGYYIYEHQSRDIRTSGFHGWQVLKIENIRSAPIFLEWGNKTVADYTDMETGKTGEITLDWSSLYELPD